MENTPTNTTRKSTIENAVWLAMTGPTITNPAIMATDRHILAPEAHRHLIGQLLEVGATVPEVRDAVEHNLRIGVTHPGAKIVRQIWHAAEIAAR